MSTIPPEPGASSETPAPPPHGPEPETSPSTTWAAASPPPPPPPPPNWPPPSSAVAPTAPPMQTGMGEWIGGPPTYPVSVLYERPPHNSRFFAIPLIGILARIILLIPHLIVVYILGIVIYITQLFLWLIVLLTGHYPRWGYSLIGGYIRWYTRLMAYFFGLTDKYPPFRLRN
jgi:hypothetical protein